MARRHAPGPDHLAAVLTGAQVRAVDRRGKYLWLVVRPDPGAEELWAHERAGADDPASGEVALIVHLGMSGQMLVQAADMPEPTHTHGVFPLVGEGGVESGAQLRFVDQRTFGGFALSGLTGAQAGHPHGIPVTIGHIAPDPLEPAFDLEAVVARMRRSASGIKRVLLNQNVISGIGNIYADESLWRARLHGERPASTLTAPAVRRLLEHAHEVLVESLAQGGTSFDALYVNVNGQSGYFSRSLDAYGQEGRPCRRCGRLIRREQFMNRSSYSCPGCQSRPRALSHHA